MSEIGPDSHLYLIDGSGFIFRAYHVLPPLTRKADGLPVGAVYGFSNMLFKLLEDMKAGERPTHIACVLDHSERTFRNELYPQYKANRPDPPEDLVPQFALVRDAVRAFNVPCIDVPGYEADDLIATYACQAAAAGAKVTIVSSDKDLMQIVGDRIELLDTMKMKRMGVPEVYEKFGVGPDKVVDVQSLAGDSVDNVPGVPGIGIKTAAQLINEYGDLDGLYAHVEEIKQPKRREALIANREAALISRELVRLKTDVPVEVPVGALTVDDPKPAELVGFLKAMDFTSLTRRVASTLGIEDVDAIEPAAALVPSAAERLPVTAGEGGAAAPAADGAGLGPVGAIRDEALVRLPIDYAAYETVRDLDALDRWIGAAFEAGEVVLDIETTSLDAMSAELVGLSLSTGPGKAAYLPLAHSDERDGELGFGGGIIAGQIPLKEALARLKPLLEDPSILKIGQNLKFDALVLSRYGIDVTPIDDTMLISYVLEAGLHGHGMNELAEILLDHRPIAFKDVAGTGKGRISFAAVDIAAATRYAAEDADVTGRLWRLMKPRLARNGLATVYETLERPLVPVLLRMEKAGIRIDPDLLSRFSHDFAQGMARLEAEAQELAGEPFNLGSPKQLGDILFGRMNLPGGKKTKTGAWSTGADVLEELAAEGVPLARTILDWRQISKLKSTYTDALPSYINKETGRVHTCFALASTTTGRLSSSEPNLQNIPIRTEEGRKIRTAFIASPGHVLISADYSQIELRVLAHIADIGALKKAFADGIDIHAMTASEMFGVPIEGMDPMVRRRAKAINFGIIYGISAFGLANQLSIPQREASDYIKAYFERFPGIRAYMDATRRQAREKGYVETLFGRRCHTPDIHSKAQGQRAFAERAAINAPIQGTAADIIRRAMIRIQPALERSGLRAQMLLQVHDELVFEVPEDEAEATAALVREIMAGAAEPARRLSVPLVVEAKAGRNWEEAH